MARGLRWALSATLSLAGGPQALRAQEPTEYLVKGAYLFKFGDFVEWPGNALPKPGQPFVIGILGEDPFGPRLDEAVRGHQIQGRPIQVRRFHQPEEVWDVQILYLGAAGAAQRDLIARSLEGLSILTVCDGDAHPGAVLRFITRGGKVRFAADLAAAEQRQLKLSSKLLSLAVSLKADPLPAGR